MLSAIEKKAEQLLFKLNAEENIEEVLAAAPPTRLRRESDVAAPHNAPRTTKSRDSSIRPQQRPKASSKQTFSKNYVSPFVTKAQQLAIERAVSARKRIREERLRAKAEAEARENHARGRTRQPQAQVPSHINTQGSSTFAGGAMFSSDPAVSIELNEMKQSKGSSYRLPVSNTVPPKPMTIRKKNQVPTRRPFSANSASTPITPPQAEQNFVIADGNTDVHELPSPQPNIRGNWPRLAQRHTAESKQHIGNLHELSPTTGPPPTISSQQRPPSTPSSQQQQQQQQQEQPRLQIQPQARPQATSSTAAAATPQSIQNGAQRGAAPRLRTPPPSRLQVPSTLMGQEIPVNGQMDDNVVRLVSRATQTGERDGVTIVARPRCLVSSDLPSVKFNRQYRRNRATSPFDLHTVERLLAGRYEDSGDGSVSTQQDSLPSPGAKERKEQRRQRQPVVEQLPLHNSTETPRKMHLPHTVAINDLNSNAVPSGTAEVYQQVLSAQVATQQAQARMFSSIATMIKNMQHSSNSSSSSNRVQSNPPRSASTLERHPHQTGSTIPQTSLPAATGASSTVTLSKRELLQTLLSKIQELERVEHDTAQFLENPRAIPAPATEVTAPLPEPVPRMLSVHPAPARLTTVQRTAPCEIGGGSNGDDSRADRFNAPPVLATHEAAVRFKIFHTEHPTMKPVGQPKRCHRGSRRVALQFETERRIHDYLAEFERCRNLRELKFNDRGAELHQLIERLADEVYDDIYQEVSAEIEEFVDQTATKLLLQV